MIVEMNPSLVWTVAGKIFFKKIESFDGKAIIKYDIEKRSKMVITDLTMKEGYVLKDFNIPAEMTILDVMKKSGRTYTVLMKVEAKKKGALVKQYSKYLKFIDIDVIYDIPFHCSEKKLVLSCIGEGKELEKALKAFKLLGKVTQIHFQKAVFAESNPLSCLTPKQKEIVVQAKKSGYYDYPRRISSQELADHIGISKSTTIEHLRKAEIRLLSNMLAGY